MYNENKCGFSREFSSHQRRASARVLFSNVFITMRTSLALAAAGFLLITAPALAAGRPVRGDASPAPAPILLTVPVLIATDGIFSRTSGSIHSSNTVSTDSGGNSGSNVTTGDQSSSVTVVNIDPANNNSGTVVSLSAADSTTAPQCSGRACPRAR